MLNAWEKETLGLFLSSHPLKEVRPALRAKVDCSLAEVGERKDGDWVTVGGMISECKRIRTKKGDPMMFATLDDLEGQVEVLIFNSAYAKNEGQVEVDRVVLIRGRVDHKEAGETKIVAQEVEPFEPTPEEVEVAAAEMAAGPVVRRLTLHVSPGVPEGFLVELRDVVGHHPGDHELLLAVGERRLLLGRRIPGVGEQRLLQRAGCPARGRPRRRLTARSHPEYRSTMTGCNRCPHRPRSSTSAASAAPSATGSFTRPGCIASGCQFLYLYDDEDTGRRYMGCMNKVFRGEIDAEMFEQAERTRQGFGGVKMTGLPLPQCRAAVERAYDGFSEAFDCVNPEFFETPVPDEFDLRDHL